jgi:hypothetical protein
MRPVVLDTGALHCATGRHGQTARAVLGAAIATVLAAGAIAAGGWSLMTAAHGGTPANQPSPLWYPTPPPLDTGHDQDAAQPSPAASDRIIVPGVARRTPTGRGPDHPSATGAGRDSARRSGPATTATAAARAASRAQGRH